MRKVLFLFATLFLYAASSYAQRVEFNLQRDGSFIAKDGKSYVVVEYEGKTAEELYSMVKSNVIVLYNSPKHVMNENEPTKLTIHAKTKTIDTGYQAYGGGFVSYSAYYTYIFQFKDGRIRIDAPLIQPKLDVDATGTPVITKTFAGLINDWYDKNGNLKKKKIGKIKEVENILIAPINYLIGSNNSGSEDDDW